MKTIHEVAKLLSAKFAGDLRLAISSRWPPVHHDESTAAAQANYCPASKNGATVSLQLHLLSFQCWGLRARLALCVLDVSWFLFLSLITWEAFFVLMFVMCSRYNADC